MISFFLTLAGVAIVGPGTGAMLKMEAVKIAVLTTGIWIGAEIVFFSSLAVLGKDIVAILKEKIKVFFKKKE